MAVVLPQGKQQFFTATGAPAAGWKLYAYIAGTSTPKDTYTDSGELTQNPHPVVMDSRGEAAIYWSGTYDVVLKDAADVTIWGPERLNEPETSGVADTLRSDLATANNATKGAGQIGYSVTLAYADNTVGEKLLESVSVLDYDADPTGVSDSTSAFVSAQADSDNIYIPPGTYLLDNFKQENRKVFRGAGLNNTFLKQSTNGNPAWWCVSKTGTYETQIIGAGLSGVWFLGKSTATVAACIVEAISPYVVAYSNFDIGGSGGYHTLKVICGSAFEVYSNTFKVYQDDPDNRSGGVGSYNIGVVCGAGVYNRWYLNIAKSSVGKAWSSSDWGAVFEHAVSDGSQVYNGAHNTIVAPTVEAWTGTADGDGAIQILGDANRAIGVTLTNVPSASCGGLGIALNGGGGNNSTIIGYRVFGTYPTTAPVYPMSVPTGNTGTIADAYTAGCQYKLENYVSEAILQGFQFVGACGTLTNRGKTKRTGVSTDRGDTSQTLTAGTDAETQLWSTTLTANRTVTLSTTSAIGGDKFRIVRTGLGAFTLDVGGLKTIASATAAYVDVAYNGSAWVLTGYGAL